MKRFLVILLTCLFVIGCSPDHQRKPKTSEDTTSAVAK
ncbi:hypothetical protein AYM02_08185 [Coxiella burnetii]|nr:putative lipoprotein [Coxiella burnetii RSA 331]AIT63122.1 Putative lipoprotein [Coxiella burnetii str. Namibia]AML49284.1 hypothetical protein AUR58_08935 [Coxiella burnetii]ATN85720.1 hypothetical protein AYO29_04175 [Coxiella burnetii str. Schperling]EAX33784.1 hypothetical protein A35_04235 [Coxiella burnetii 'MSU Goat Q177']EDR36297.1 putative lipoprotein [Coxiella burnetii Q321]